MNISTAFARDLIERAVKTFLQAFVAALVLSPVIDVSVLQKGALAGLAAIASILSSTVSKQVGNHDSASLVVDATPSSGLMQSLAPDWQERSAAPVLGGPGIDPAVIGTPDPANTAGAEVARAIKHSAQTAPDPKDVPHG